MLCKLVFRDEEKRHETHTQKKEPTTQVPTDENFDESEHLNIKTSACDRQRNKKNLKICATRTVQLH